MGDHDISDPGFTLPEKERRVQPYDKYTRKAVTERELLEKLKAMAPNVAKAIQAEFVRGWKEVQQRRKGE